MSHFCGSRAVSITVLGSKDTKKGQQQQLLEKTLTYGWGASSPVKQQPTQSGPVWALQEEAG